MRRAEESSKEHTAVGRTEIEQRVAVKLQRHRRMVQKVVQPRSPGLTADVDVNLKKKHAI